MLGPDYIEHFTDAAQGAMDEYTLRLVCIFAALIGSIDFEGDSAYSQAARKAALAAKDVQKAMNEEGRRAAREAAKAAAEAVAKSAEADLATLGTAMGALSKTMQWRLHNSARATAAGVQDVVSRDNLKMPANVQRAYLEVVAQAVARVNSGMAGYEQATREAVLKLARRGVSVVDYKSGAWAQADVAMRRHIRTQAVQAGSRNTLELLEETGHDLVQTSSHGGARESHAKWQGRVFSLSGKSKKYPPFYRETGYGSVDGLCGANCKHDFGIYVEGQQLRYERDPDGGDEKREERYQAEQKQRELERGIRAAKREATALEAAGLDNTKERLRLGKLQKRQREHIAAHPYLSRERTREAAVESNERIYPLATDKTWVREKFMPGKGAGTAADVSRRAVNGRAYHDKVASLPIPKRASEAVYAESRRILRDRDGTGYERMSVVSWKKGERVTDTFGHGLKSQACGLTAKQVEACRRTEGGVVLIHNHPMSSPPSWTDIRTVAENDWVRSSVVACHDGTIYEIKVNDRSVVQAYEELRELAKRECPNVGGDVIDQLATEMLYERNEEAKWFRLTKKK